MQRHCRERFDPTLSVMLAERRHWEINYFW
jgi:hypothetical protein